MAADWIKFEITTPDKPEVIRMADILRLDQDAVVGKLLRVWVWADANSIAAGDMTITEAFIDRLTARKGFAAAMRAVGWLQGDAGSLSFPNFERHNGVTAKARADSNRRMKKSREIRNEDCGNVAENPQQKPQPEKRREEIEVQEQAPRVHAGEQPTLEEVKAYAPTVMATPECAEAYWNDGEGAGWVNRHGLPISDWRALFRNYATRWKANDAQRQQRGLFTNTPKKPKYTSCL